MKRINTQKIDVLYDIDKTCRKYEKIIGDSVQYTINGSAKENFCWHVVFLKNKSFVDDLLENWIFDNQELLIDVPVENFSAQWGAHPIIKCEEIGDCAKGFKFLLENYPPWQEFRDRMKLQKRTVKRIGKSVDDAPPLEAL